MNNILFLIFVFVFGGLGLIAIFAIINLLLPLPVEKTRQVLENSLGRSLLLGVVNFLFAALITGLLLWPARIGGVVAGVCIFLAGLVVLFVVAFTILGLVALMTLLGSRLGETKSAITSHLRAAGLLILACITPFLGWFVITPLVAWTAFGAALQIAIRRKEKAVVPTES